MKRFFAVAGAIVGWAIGCALPQYGHWPRPFYDPAGRTWWWARSAPPLPMGYYGLILWGCAGAAVGGLTGAALGRRPQTDTFTLAAAWALTAAILVAAYFTWNLWPSS
jgi:hypothetical protein